LAEEDVEGMEFEYFGWLILEDFDDDDEDEDDVDADDDDNSPNLALQTWERDPMV